MLQTTSVNDLIQEARAGIENLNVSAVQTELQRPDVVLVDVREPDERLQNGTIPGAMAAPRGMLEFYADSTTPYHKEQFDPQRRILLYCAAGSRSALAAATLRRLGFDRVAHLDGGFKAWKESGGEVVAAQD
jgi:rhodanese-related sulfurtransferase